jgi:hypothetical protein
MIRSWDHMMEKLRIHPGAVCRQLLSNLNRHEPLTASEEDRIIRAIENAGVPNGVDRLLAGLSRNTLEKLLGSMG